MAAERWRARLSRYLPLIETILAQSERRVLEGLTVPASEKLVSLFEPHAGIILKGGHTRATVSRIGGRGRDAGYPAPPAQIRTCGITAYGSCPGDNATRSAGLGEDDKSGPWG